MWKSIGTILDSKSNDYAAIWLDVEGFVKVFVQWNIERAKKNVSTSYGFVD